MRHEGTLDGYVFPHQFVRDKLVEMKRRHRLTNTEMAKIAGYERAAWQRFIKGHTSIRADFLHRISVHFGVPMSHWFPPSETGDVLEPPSQSDVPASIILTPKEKRFLVLMSGLSPEEQDMVLNVLPKAFKKKIGPP